jgi:ethanolamine phosphate transferase 2 subunit G
VNPYVVVLVLLRIARRYNQTGQKHAGAPDIVHSTLLTDPYTLWTLIGLTYAELAVSLKTDFMGNSPKVGPRVPDYTALQLLGMSGAASIGSLAFAFKLAFTSRDAPELLEGLIPGLEQWLEDVPLVALARMVFVSLIAGAVWMIVTMERKESGNGKRECIISIPSRDGE